MGYVTKPTTHVFCYWFSEGYVVVYSALQVSCPGEVRYTVVIPMVLWPRSELMLKK